MNRELENYLSSLTTADESAIWEKKIKIFFLHLAAEKLSTDFFMNLKIFLIPLPISEKSIRIEPSFAQKRTEVVFHPLTPPLRMRCSFWRKIRKFISRSLTNPSGQEWAYWPKTFEKYVFYYLATVEGIFCRGKIENPHAISDTGIKNI